MKLNLVKHPDFKFEIAPALEAVEPRHVEIADALAELMVENGLRALSAPQAGVTERIMVVDWSKEGEPPNPIRMFDPDVCEYNAWVTPDRTGWETCVSLPGVRKWVRRGEDVETISMDADGKTEYRLFCNEDVPPVLRAIDYLDGRTIMDGWVHTSPRLKPHESRSASALASVAAS